MYDNCVLWSNVVLKDKNWVQKFIKRQLWALFLTYTNDHSCHYYQILQHSIFLRANRLLFRSFPYSSSFDRLWVHFNLWKIRNNHCAILHKLHENLVQRKKFFMLFSSIWFSCIFALLCNAIHRIGIEVNNRRWT